MSEKQPIVVVADIRLTPQQEFPLDAAPISVEDIWDFTVRSWELAQVATHEYPDELRSALYDLLYLPDYQEKVRLTLDAWLNVFNIQKDHQLDALVQSAFARITTLQVTMTPTFNHLLRPYLEQGFQVAKVKWSPGNLMVQFNPT